jgi:hypothetical protein
MTKNVALTYLIERCQLDMRCPTDEEFSNAGVANSTEVLAGLARNGLIRIEVYGKNFRTVWFCDGEYHGMHTALPPAHYKPAYKTFGPERPA